VAGPMPVPGCLDMRFTKRRFRDYWTRHLDMNKPYGRAIPIAWRRISRMYVALGDPHRQRILLMFEPGERLNLGQIVFASTLSRTAVSHHLRVLREAGVLKSKKAGRMVYFWPDVAAVRNALAAVQDYLAQHH